MAFASSCSDFRWLNRQKPRTTGLASPNLSAWPSAWPSGVTAVYPDESLQGRTKDLDPLWNLFFAGALLADGPGHGGFSFS